MLFFNEIKDKVQGAIIKPKGEFKDSYQIKIISNFKGDKYFFPQYSEGKFASPFKDIYIVNGRKYLIGDLDNDLSLGLLSETAAENYITNYKAQLAVERAKIVVKEETVKK